jgi:hypothetical protein
MVQMQLKTPSQPLAELTDEEQRRKLWASESGEPRVTGFGDLLAMMCRGFSSRSISAEDDTDLDIQPSEVQLDQRRKGIVSVNGKDVDNIEPGKNEAA